MKRTAQPILTVSVYKNFVHAGCDTDGNAFTPCHDGQSPMVAFFEEGGKAPFPELVGHAIIEPGRALLWASALENFHKGGIALLICGYQFPNGQELLRAAQHLRRVAEQAEAFREAA